MARGGSGKPTTLAAVTSASFTEVTAVGILTFARPFSFAFALSVASTAGASLSWLISRSCVGLDVGSGSTRLGRIAGIRDGLACLDASLFDPVTLQFLGVGKFTVLLVAAVWDTSAVASIT